MYLKHAAEEITALRSALRFHRLPARHTASQHHSCKDSKIFNHVSLNSVSRTLLLTHLPSTQEWKVKGAVWWEDREKVAARGEEEAAEGKDRAAAFSSCTAGSKNTTRI